CARDSVVARWYFDVW
nr:immunoglobulin heavy chain junction region [Mus musculus]